MSPKALTPAELAAARAARRAAQNPQNPEPQQVESSTPANGSSAVDFWQNPQVAQGRPQPALRLEDLPDAVENPDADGPLTPEEEERWELCQRSFAEFRQAWFVAAKALDIALKGRLWRRDFETAESFIKAVAGMSTSNAYRQIAGAEVAAILAQPTRIELESNDLSRMRDSAADHQSGRALVISQRAAEALGPITGTLGAEAAATVYRTIAEVTGQEKVSGKLITGVVRQLAPASETVIDEEKLQEQVRVIIGTVQQDEDPVKAYAAYVAAASEFARKTRGMAAAYRRASAADATETEKLTTRLKAHMASAAGNFPQFPE